MCENVKSNPFKRYKPNIPTNFSYKNNKIFGIKGSTILTSNLHPDQNHWAIFIYETILLMGFALLPMVQVVEELIQLMPLFKARLFWNDFVVRGIKAGVESSEHAGNRQIVFVMAVKRSGIKND